MLLLFLLLSFSFSLGNECQELITKVIKPPPAIRILNQQGDFQLLDPKETYELQRQYIQEILRLTDLLGRYIQLRRESEEIAEYLQWQWRRVEAGIEYKKDIWRQQIDLNRNITELKNIELQLFLLGVSPYDLDRCYKSKRR